MFRNFIAGKGISMPEPYQPKVFSAIKKFDEPFAVL